MSFLRDLWRFLRLGIRARAQRAENAEFFEANRRRLAAHQQKVIENLPLIDRKHNPNRAAIQESVATALDKIKYAHLVKESITPQTAKMLVRDVLEQYPIDPDWMTPWQDWLNSLRWDGWWPAIIGLTGRREGSYYPFFRSEQELMILRDISRTLYEVNNHAKGGIGAYTGYVVRQGFKLSVADRDKAGSNAELVKQADNFIERFVKQNRWYVRQRSAFTRYNRDGEAWLRIFSNREGNRIPVVRFLWPEQIRRPLAAGEKDQDWLNWSYGCYTPDPNDIETVTRYAVHTLDYQDMSWESVDARDILHLKANVDEGVKRGIPLLVWGMKQALELAGRLETNLGEGAAIQAAIAYITEYQMAGPQEITSIISQNTDYNEQRPWNNQPSRPVQQFDPGTVIHTDKNQKFLPGPANQAIVGLSGVVGLLCRSAASRINAPEWIFSADASNNNFAGQLVAESPFVIHCEGMQEVCDDAFMRLIVRAVEMGIENDLLPADTLQRVEVKQEVQSPAVRDKLKEAQVDGQHIQNKVISPQQATRNAGYDPKEQAEEIAAFAKQQAEIQQASQPQQPAGPVQPGQPEGEPNNPPENAGTQLTPQVQESIRQLVGSILREDHGSPPHPGLIFDETVHRWVKPEDHSSAQKPVTATTNTKPEVHPLAQSFQDRMSKHMDENEELEPKKKAQFKEALKLVTSAMPEAALKLLHEGVKSAKFVGSLAELADEFDNAGGNLNQDDVINGFYQGSKGHLVVNGATSHENDVGFGEDNTSKNVHGTYAHEMGHAIDRGDDTKTADGKRFKLSSSPEWREAYKLEIAGTETTLSEYAKTDASEGFAEFCRLLYGTPGVDKKEAEKRFPKCFAFARSKGLVK